MVNKIIILVGLFLVVFQAHGKKIMTNEVQMNNAPEWLRRNRVEKVTDSIQRELEWSTRRVSVYWYSSQAKFQKAHKFGPYAAAFARRKNGVQTIHLGPRVNKKNFDKYFGHELVHIIIFQKYKDVIPKWLEEGLANHLSKKGKVDYKWLAARSFPKDVRKLIHPYQGTREGVTYHYKSSQALIEMLAKKCDLSNLIRLSVKRKMESYISTYCEIKDINKSFQAWIKKKSAI